MLNVPRASLVAWHLAMQYGLKRQYEAEGLIVTYYSYRGCRYVTDIRKVSSQDTCKG